MKLYLLIFVILLINVNLAKASVNGFKLNKGKFGIPNHNKNNLSNFNNQRRKLLNLQNVKVDTYTYSFIKKRFSYFSSITLLFDIKWNGCFKSKKTGNQICSEQCEERSRRRYCYTRVY